MSRFIFFLVIAVATGHPGHTQLSERAQRLLGKQKAIVPDSIITICHPSINVGTAKVFLFKQVKKSNDDLNGSKLVDFVSYDGKRRASFEVRSIHGAVGTLKDGQTKADKFLQRWNEAREVGDANFTVNASGNIKFKFTPPKSTTERVLFFSHSTPGLAELRTGFTKSNTYSCSIAVVPDEKLKANPVVHLDNEDCLLDDSDSDCVALGSESEN